MVMFEKRKPLAARRTPEAVLKIASRLLEMPARSIRLCRTGGFEADTEYEMKFLIRGFVIDRYEIRFRNGTYTIFDRLG